MACRTRPFLYMDSSSVTKGERENLGKEKECVVQVVEENEMLCFDRKSNEWRPFVFDRCWDLDATQVMFTM